MGKLRQRRCPHRMGPQSPLVAGGYSERAALKPLQKEVLRAEQPASPLTVAFVVMKSMQACRWLGPAVLIRFP